MSLAGFISLLRKPSTRKLLESVVSLYGVQMGRKLIPLITIPYLTRVLGNVEWGKVVFVTAAAELLVIIIEFGFNLSATREVARNRESKEACGEVMSGVLGAQFLLALVGVTLAALIYQWIPMLNTNRDLVVGGLIYAVAQGISPVWFFQGLERMKLSSTIEISGKVAALAGMFVFVHSAADAWKWMALCGVAPAAGAVIAFTLAIRTYPLRVPGIENIQKALHTGLPRFVFRSAESLYGVGNAFLLGLFAPPELVGYFGLAEKISKAAYGLLLPVRDSIYPRLSNLAKGGLDMTAPLARIGTMVMVGGGLVVSAGLYVGAPFIMQVMQKQPVQAAVDVMRILSVIPFLLSISTSAGMQWLLPFGQDAVINRVIIVAGLINVCLSLVLARHYQHIGMAWAVTISEVFVAVAMSAAAWRMVRDPGQEHSLPKQNPAVVGS